ncbi:hypothetical protein [Curtobacterium aetherium]|uniref:Uncharacterized protein n=1 Tax=Curtobacterium aetherium TaxID=2841594 RepID=A0ACD1E3K8_9MICO|nr:hypothetical protein [Curtobacterium sp. L6-1]QWS33558.1 hypothetical protein KM842_15225 [Curtobacterium sp. L6-1]
MQVDSGLRRCHFSRSSTGVGTSANQVEHRSPDCGSLVMSGGLTTEAAEKKADEVEIGERYDVEIDGQ